jgi:hypothetical protein
MVATLRSLGLDQLVHRANFFMRPFEEVVHSEQQGQEKHRENQQVVGQRLGGATHGDAPAHAGEVLHHNEENGTKR